MLQDSKNPALDEMPLEVMGIIYSTHGFSMLPSAQLPLDKSLLNRKFFICFAFIAHAALKHILLAFLHFPFLSPYTGLKVLNVIRVL